MNSGVYFNRLRLAGKCCSVVTLLLGFIGLTGWFFGQPLWRSFWKTGSEMKFNTALSFALFGAALLLAYHSGPRVRRAGILAAALTLVITAFTLAEYVCGRNFGIDELVFKDSSLVGTTFAGRMSSHSALTFILLAVGALALKSTSAGIRRWPQWCALGSLIFPMQALIGYLSGHMTVVGLGPQTSYMALPTSVAFLCGALALLLHDPDRDLMESLTARTHASAVFRRLLAASLILPLVLCWLALHVGDGHQPSTEYSVTTIAFATTFLFIALTWFNAARANAVANTMANDLIQRKLVEQELAVSQERYRTLFDSIDEGFCIVEVLFDGKNQAVDCRYLEINPSFEKQSGLTNALGKTLREMIPGIEDHWFETFGQVVSSRQPVRFQNRAEELHRWYDVYAFPFGAPEKNQLAMLFTNISDRRQTEIELLETRARLESTLVATEVATWTWDIKPDRVYADQNMARLFSVSPEDANGGPIQKYLDAIHPEDLPRIKSAIADALQSGAGQYDVDYRLIQPDKSVRWVSARGKVERDQDGQPARFPGVVIDITERKQAEVILRQNEALFSALIDLAPTGVYVVDAQFRLQQINALALPVFAQVEPKIGRDFGEVMRILWGPELGGEIVKIFRHTLVTGERYVSPRFSEFRHDLGEEQAYEWEIQRMTLPDNSHGVVCYFNDITRQKREAQASQQLAAIVESSADAIISKDINGIITTWNHGAEQLFGYAAAEVMGRPVTILMPPERLNEEPKILERIRRGERIEHYETVRRRKDGKLIEISLTVSPIKDAAGKVIGASKIGRNITKQKLAERELELAHQEAVAASRAKDDFLAALSHELRTPLNPALLLASESADNHELPEAVRLNFETIRKNIELEARLIDDLLDLTRITTGKIVISKSLVDVHDILTDAIATTQAEQQEKKIHLDIHLNAPQSVVQGDAVRLQQVFWNILKNAVKFTPAQGRITLETSIPPAGRLLIRITDTGIGMTAAEVARVFTAFAQGDHAGGGGSHRFGGLGLGLAISKNLIDLHAGKITAQSAGLGQGSVFTIELPLAVETQATPKIENNLPRQSPSEFLPEPPVALSVLLVEDHEITRTVMAQLLTRRNYQVIAVDSIAQAREAAKLNKFNLLISDIGLPDGNGNDLMNEFREKYGVQGIALTGYGMEADIARGHAAGFVAHLIKPVRIQSLENALAIARHKASILPPPS